MTLDVFWFPKSVPTKAVSTEPVIVGLERSVPRLGYCHLGHLTLYDQQKLCYSRPLEHNVSWGVEHQDITLQRREAVDKMLTSGTTSVCVTMDLLVTLVFSIASEAPICLASSMVLSTLRYSMVQYTKGCPSEIKRYILPLYYALHRLIICRCRFEDMSWCWPIVQRVT